MGGKMEYNFQEDMQKMYEIILRIGSIKPLDDFVEFTNIKVEPDTIKKHLEYLVNFYNKINFDKYRNTERFLYQIESTHYLQEKYGDIKLKKNKKKIEEYRKDWRGVLLNYVVYGVKPTKDELEEILHNGEMLSDEGIDIYEILKKINVIEVSESEYNKRRIEDLQKRYMDEIEKGDFEGLVTIVGDTWTPEIGEEFMQEIYDELIKRKQFKNINLLAEYTGIEPNNPLYKEYKEIREKEKHLKEEIKSLEGREDDYNEEAIRLLQRGDLDKLEKLIKEKGVTLPKDVVLKKYEFYLNPKLYEWGHEYSSIDNLKRLMELTGVKVPTELVEKRYILSIKYDRLGMFDKLWRTLKIRPTGELFEHRFRGAIHRYVSKNYSRYKRRFS